MLTSASCPRGHHSAHWGSTCRALPGGAQPAPQSGRTEHAQRPNRRSQAAQLLISPLPCKMPRREQEPIPWAPRIVHVCPDRSRYGGTSGAAAGSMVQGAHPPVATSTRGNHFWNKNRAGGPASVPVSATTSEQLAPVFLWPPDVTRQPGNRSAARRQGSAGGYLTNSAASCS
jgi:hypothetical protein